MPKLSDTGSSEKKDLAYGSLQSQVENTIIR